jgi:O-acetylhomoserine (thiol)-lyase
MFGRRQVGYTYTRTSNPTRDIVERRLAARERGAGALIVASGTAARPFALLNLAAAGDNIVAPPGLADGPGWPVSLPRMGLLPAGPGAY